jgi:methyl-accepting chemotaxis protein
MPLSKQHGREHGRGFAVVADEVRTLAERTRSSANEVDLMIREIQSGTSRVVDAMAVSIKKTEETVGKTEHSHQQLNVIQEQITRIDLLAHNVQEAMNIQIAASEEAQESVQSMAELNESALMNTAIQAVTPDDLSKFFQSVLTKFENHGFNRTNWESPRRENIRQDKEQDRNIQSLMTNTVADSDIELF